ncbi:hypothetical protein GT354_35255, partial [Streptomyces sp. SID3343]|nr:hypothetical protein [Streptomyces sp. SID3343]
MVTCTILPRTRPATDQAGGAVVPEVPLGTGADDPAAPVGGAVADVADGDA